jgi:hypothetical protein
MQSVSAVLLPICVGVSYLPHLAVGYTPSRAFSRLMLPLPLPLLLQIEEQESEGLLEGGTATEVATYLIISAAQVRQSKQQQLECSSVGAAC